MQDLIYSVNTAITDTRETRLKLTERRWTMLLVSKQSSHYTILSDKSYLNRRC